MAAFAAIWKRSTATASGDGIDGYDPYALRALPGDDVFFHVKRIDNSRMVRMADPRAGQECWSAVGAGAVVLALFASIAAPHVALVNTGYRLEALKTERRTLLDERRALEVREAFLMSPGRLNGIAQAGNLTSPSSGQVVHLEGKSAHDGLASSEVPTGAAPLAGEGVR